jgi:hypothetical protein
MTTRRLILALNAALLLVAASASAHASGQVVAGPDQVACTDEGSATQGCGGQRCLYVEQWVGARTAGPTFPTTCRQVATIARHSAG